MRGVKKVYGHFDMLQRNKEQQLTKITYSSLDKYNKSPYLSKVIQSTHKKGVHRSITPTKFQVEKEREVGKNGGDTYQLPKISTPIQYKEGQIINYFHSETENHQKHISNLKHYVGTHSSTLEVNSKKNKLEPIRKSHKLHFSVRTKAGTNGKQTKINQDIAIVQVRFPYGIKLFCVCDGHGLNGHLVSAFIKNHLLKNLNGSFNKLTNLPSIEEVKQIVNAELLKTNKQLLDSDINTELSGSTVVAIVLFGTKILSFNIGDSRAIMIKQKPLKRQSQCEKKGSGSEIVLKKKDLSQKFSFHKENTCQWDVVELTIDQKPDRTDEHQRIVNNGGRIFSQKNENGEDLGPLRVWMKDVMMPGLAMTRSFGDKAGLKAGTSGDPQILDFDMTEEDKFMIVASDGIWQYLQNEQVMELMVPYYLKDDLEMGAQRLVRIVTEIWHKVSLSRDDITAIIVSLNPPLK